jgi:hypothetical protein
MQGRVRRVGRVGVWGIAVLALPLAAFAQSLPRTPDGQPDVQGYWGSNAYTQDLETGLPDQETNTIQGRGPVDTSKAISRIVDPPDGKIPYQPWAQKRVRIPTYRRGEVSRGDPKSSRDIRPQTMDYTVTITDPGVLTRPFTIRLPYQRTNRPASYEPYEEACVEGTGADQLGFSVRSGEQ